jgi:hypothetical protein
VRVELARRVRRRRLCRRVTAVTSADRFALSPFMYSSRNAMTFSAL